MTDESRDLAHTIKAMRPVVPAKNFELSKRFYADLGFRPEPLSEKLVEMRLGAFSFLLQDYYVAAWADNFVIHLRVSDLSMWWKRIVAQDLASRYGVKTKAPQMEVWGLVAGIADPSGVLWRIFEARDLKPS